MNNNELENNIRKALKINEDPSRVSFAYMLSQLPEDNVTKYEEVRYTKKAATPNIINNKIAEILGICKSRRIILIPSLALAIFVSIFSLSPHRVLYSESLQHIAEQDEIIEGLVDDTDTDVIVTSFDNTDTNDLGILNNEI